jgi:nicotinamide mononucleotide transporter
MLAWWNSIFFSVLDYPVSYLEFLATISGLICVWLAAKNNILTWPIGIINIVTSFIIYYQVALYSDVFLQVYFFVTAIYGWYFWNQQKTIIKKISQLTLKSKIACTSIIIITTLILGYGMSQIHFYFPKLFPVPAAYPYADTLVAVASIVANFLMAKRILENWVLWIFVDLLACYLYYTKGIKFIALEYVVFTALAAYGLYAWMKERKRYSLPSRASGSGP